MEIKHFTQKKKGRPKWNKPHYQFLALTKEKGRDRASNFVMHPFLVVPQRIHGIGRSRPVRSVPDGTPDDQQGEASPQNEIQRA
ncbi:MAG TPA: hypothetical protein DCR93_04800 [Cytophagales bacterium]|nr:hypothetical protein [Cytophagales bacterium]